MGDPPKFELPHVCSAESRTCKLRSSPIRSIVREQGATDAEKMGASPYMFAGTVDHRRFGGRELSLGRGAGATRAGSHNPANSPHPEHATAQNVLQDD
jgi:hypothetical protein